MWSSSSADYYTHSALDSAYGLDLRRNLDVVRNETGHYSTELFTKEAVNVIKSHDKKQPLFLYLSHQGVHSGNPDNPLQVPDKYTKKLKHIKNQSRRKYAGKALLSWYHFVVVAKFWSRKTNGLIFLPFLCN